MIQSPHIDSGGTTEDSGFCDVEQFLRESGVLIDIQKRALETKLHHIANDHGFELLHIHHDHHPVVEFSLYVGNQDERRTSLRCRSMVCGLLRSAGLNVRKDKVFTRYRRSVIRCVFVPSWD